MSCLVLCAWGACNTCLHTSSCRACSYLQQSHSGHIHCQGSIVVGCWWSCVYMYFALTTLIYVWWRPCLIGLQCLMRPDHHRWLTMLVWVALPCRHRWCKTHQPMSDHALCDGQHAAVCGMPSHVTCWHTTRGQVDVNAVVAVLFDLCVGRVLEVHDDIKYKVGQKDNDIAY